MYEDSEDPGFVTSQHIYDVFSKYMDVFDNKIWPDPNGPVPRQVHLVEFINNIKLELLKRSKANLKEYLKRHPQILREATKYSRQARENMEAISKPDSRQEFYDRKNRFNRT